VNGSSVDITLRGILWTSYLEVENAEIAAHETAPSA
jgi:hypothetical protein